MVPELEELTYEERLKETHLTTLGKGITIYKLRKQKKSNNKKKRG